MGNVSQKEIEEYLSLSGKDFDLLLKNANEVRQGFLGKRGLFEGCYRIY